MRLYQLLLTENACYRAGRTIAPKGVMVHSTGVNNPNLRRYVGPDDGFLGMNANRNHWNTYHPDGREVCVHAFIGKLKDGGIATYQTLPWNHRGWHAGGSANSTHIGFEICEDGLKDAGYFEKVYREAAELTALLCKMYGLDPMADGVVIDHREGYRRGIASNHGDVAHWFSKHGKTMDDFRREVKALLGETDSLKQFIREVQSACGAVVDGIVGPETISKTVTVSAYKNRRHKVVAAVQKRLCELGYRQVGEADGIAGPKFTAAVIAFQKDHGCVADGEITARNKTWKKLLAFS